MEKTIEESEVSQPQRAQDLLDMEKLQIPLHPLERLMLRGNLSLVEAAQEMRGRVADSVLIESHPKIKLNPAKPKEGKKMYFRDAADPDTVYVIKQTSKKRGYYLATVLRPLIAGKIKS